MFCGLVKRYAANFRRNLGSCPSRQPSELPSLAVAENDQQQKPKGPFRNASLEKVYEATNSGPRQAQDDRYRQKGASGLGFRA